MVNKYIEDRKRMVISAIIISGVLVAVIWFYMMMFLLFPEYLYELGIKGLL